MGPAWLGRKSVAGAGEAPALMLDNAGSMASSSKMDALKTASHNLRDQLKPAAIAPEHIYVSVIQLNKEVNIGASNLW
jgi:uncharacterized protein YegL